MTEQVSLTQMLDAREKRAWTQRELLSEFQLPIISFSMNIAGPVKNSSDIRRGFQLGKRTLFARLTEHGAHIAAQKETDEMTGCEGLYAVEGLIPQQLKELTCQVEDETPLGRLFDMDVIGADGIKLDRMTPRRCLICGRPAKECARSRTHTVDALQAATQAILTDALNEEDVKDAASLAVRALLYEVCVTPKPGLVDRANNGSHDDMDIYSFMASASALWPYFAKCVRVGRETASLEGRETLSALRIHGILAEEDMRHTTGGVNTHKGAIYSMGLLCAALGRLQREEWCCPEAILRTIADIAKGSVRNELRAVAQAALTAGQRIYATYGVAGIRGDAEAGFPSVLHFGLPALESALRQGRSTDEAGGIALLWLIAHTDDTNMIHRGGFAAHQKNQLALQDLLETQPQPGQETLNEMDREYIRRHLSPGGCADLLALCWMLHFLKDEVSP